VGKRSGGNGMTRGDNGSASGTLGVGEEVPAPMRLSEDASPAGSW
jgi:hypothetical protein